MEKHNVSDAQIDVQAIPQMERHRFIFETFENLPVGGAFVLVNNHDPRPLYYQFQERLPESFGWDYLEQGPVTWRVRVSKLRNAPKQDNCCGSCGG